MLLVSFNGVTGKCCEFEFLFPILTSLACMMLYTFYGVCCNCKFGFFFLLISLVAKVGQVHVKEVCLINDILFVRLMFFVARQLLNLNV
jgi:hypothetical protein